MSIVTKTAISVISLSKFNCHKSIHIIPSLWQYNEWQHFWYICDFSVATQFRQSFISNISAFCQGNWEIFSTIRRWKIAFVESFVSFGQNFARLEQNGKLFYWDFSMAKRIALSVCFISFSTKFKSFQKISTFSEILWQNLFFSVWCIF